MPDQLFEAALESSLEAKFNEGTNADPSVSAPTRATSETPQLSDDPEARFAQVLTRVQAAEQDARKSADGWLDREIKRVLDGGVCCGDGTHFDPDGVLNVMLELNTADIDKAWKVWHERTFDVRSIDATPDPDDERGRSADSDIRARRGQRAIREGMSKVTDVAKLKQKYLIKREPHRGRVADHPRIDALLERI